MEFNQILKEVNTIFRQLFNDQTIVLSEITTKDDIEAWDSLNHIQVITAIESYYSIYFELNELLAFNNIGDLCRCLQLKLK